VTSQASKLGLESRHWEIISRLLREQAPQAEVWAFGSRVNGKDHPGSDLDLVIRRGLSQEKMVNLKSAFHESDLPISVDLLHWDLIPEDFRRAIEKRYVVVSRQMGR
jgi:uncharacterized protein